MPSLPTRRLSTVRRLFAVGGFVLGSTAAAVLAVSTSEAAFNASTEDLGNRWAAGAFTLTDDDSTSRLFAFDPMVPGETQVNCIAVTYVGTSYSVKPIKLYTTLVSDTTPNLAQHIDITIEEGTGGTFADCSGFTPAQTLVDAKTLLATTTDHSTFATGVGTFVPTKTANVVSYRVSVTLGADTPNESQGDFVTADFTWEIQST